MSEAGVALIPLSAFFQNGKPDTFVRFAFCKQRAVIEEALGGWRNILSNREIRNHSGEVIFAFSDIFEPDLHGVQLQDANMEGIELGGANLSGLASRGASLYWAILLTANLRGANLVRAIC